MTILIKRYIIGILRRETHRKDIHDEQGGEIRLIGSPPKSVGANLSFYD